MLLVPALLVHLVQIQVLVGPEAPHWAYSKQLALPFLEDVAHHVSCTGLLPPESAIHLRALTHILLIIKLIHEVLELNQLIPCLGLLVDRGMNHLKPTIIDQMVLQREVPSLQVADNTNSTGMQRRISNLHALSGLWLLLGHLESILDV